MQSGNPKKIMNDSLNMISKSRNKFLNKSFQNNSNSSGTRIGANTSAGENSLKLGTTLTGNQLSIKKSTTRIVETSMKKMNATAS